VRSLLISGTSPDARRRQGLLLASLGAVGFSGKAIIVKLAYKHGVDAVTLLTYRMLFSLPLFLALAWWSGRGARRLDWRDWRVVLGLGFLGYYLSSFLDFAGLRYVSASLERLILYLNPTIVLGLSVFAFGKTVTRTQLIALVVSYAGVVCVFGRELAFSGADVPLGASLILGGAISYALYLTLSGQEVKRLGALRLTGLATSAASIICIAQFLVLRPVSALAVDPAVLWLSILNATACTFAPVLMVMMAVERIGAPMAAQAGTIGPVSTIVLAALLLGEPFTGWVVFGTALVLVGIWLLTRPTLAARRIA
jgi:drug/metabolite transporter (DMT)-like permease